MLLATGTYTGDSNDDRSITGLGFEPDFVAVFCDFATGKIWRTSAGFAGDQTSTFSSTAGTFVDGIQALESDGFQVGTHITANSSGKTYYWVAVKDDGGVDFAVGTYTGDGADDRNITVGFQPKFVFTKRIDSSSTLPDFRIDTMATDESWSASTIHADYIQTFGATTFQVGTNAGVNASGATYAWVAFGYGSTSTYTGNATDDRDITGSGFQPEFAILKEDGTSTARGRVASISSDLTLKITDSQIFVANEIQSFISDGFQIGTDADVNENSVDYHWFTTKTNPAAAAGGIKASPLTLMGVGI